MMEMMKVDNRMKRVVLVAAAALAVFAASAKEFALPRAEFAKYHLQITGRKAPAGAVRFEIDPKVSVTGKDAYRIRSEGEGVRITGSNLRSVHYGLYDFLERRGGCRWFWDGDVVPKKKKIDYSALDVFEEAQFEYRGIRYFAHRGLTRFQAEHWGPEDWKKEIDWCLKRRLNVFMLRIGQDDLFQRAFPDVVSYPDASVDLPGHGKGYDNRTLFWSLEYRGKLRQELQNYAFKRGLMVPEDFGTMTHWYSRTPKEFLDKKNPPFIERDAIDLARTSADRLIIAAHARLLKAYHDWKAGAASADDVRRYAGAFTALNDAIVDVFALHTDYSLAESYDRLDAIEKIRNPNFAKVLVENATCAYCASHQYEAAEYWYKPAAHDFADDIVRRVTADDRSRLGPYERFETYRDKRLYAKPLSEMRPSLARTQENYVRVMNALADAAEIVVK